MLVTFKLLTGFLRCGRLKADFSVEGWPQNYIILFRDATVIKNNSNLITMILS